MDTSTLPSSTDAYNALQAFNSSRPTATDYISKANSQYNIPQDQQEVTGLQGTLNNLTSSLQAVAPSVVGRTSGTFTTAGQQSALINKEQAPIATNIGNTGTTLTTAQGTQSHDEQLAGQMVQALLGQDATKYQGLMDTYTAASGAEQAAEAKREHDADLAEKAREADLSANSSGGSSDIAAIIAAMNAGNKTGGTALDPTEQYAVNNVNDIIKKTGGDANALISDYAATAVSANKGNAADKAKLQAYAAARPDLFGSGGSGLSKANALVSNWGVSTAPAPKPAVTTQVANFATQPGLGNLSTGNALNNLKSWFGL